MIDVGGNKLITFTQISNEAVGIFKNLIGKKDEKVIGCSRELLNEILQTTLPDEATADLCQVVTLEEIRESMFSISGDKSPGPDGYTAHFFRCAWSIVGSDVVQAVMDYFHTSRLIPAFNSTCVALVPKCQNPS